MRSLVRFPPITPASSATPRTSPFGPPPSITRLIVSSETATSASATARRAVAGFSETSTIRGRPARSTWVRRRRSARGGRSLAMTSPVSDVGAGRGAWPRAWSVAVEPPEVDRIPGREAVDTLGHDREGIGHGKRREDVAPLPSPPARQADRDPALAVADGKAALVTLGHDAQIRSPPRRLRHVVAEDAQVAWAEEAVRGQTEQPSDRRPDEQLERDEAGDGVTGQPEQERRRADLFGDHAKRERLPGLDRDAPQLHPADLG